MRWMYFVFAIMGLFGACKKQKDLSEVRQMIANAENEQSLKAKKLKKLEEDDKRYGPFQKTQTGDPAEPGEQVAAGDPGDPEGKFMPGDARPRRRQGQFQAERAHRQNGGGWHGAAVEVELQPEFAGGGRIGRVGGQDLADQGQTVDAGQGRQGQAALFSVSGADFLAHPHLAEEVFGAASIVVRCADHAELHEVILALEGQLTIALHMDEPDHPLASALLPDLELKAGRILVNGFGTGVEVAHAMVHGGPFPATSDSRTTSVGTLAIARFLRPVSYQNLPVSLLPDELKPENPLGLVRRVDGKLNLT